MKGFTLIELLVVISIIVILIVVALPSYNEYSRNQKLNDAASQLQSILRQAQNNAQTGTVCKIGTLTYTASSWKVTLNANNYRVFPVCAGAPASPTPIPQQYSLPQGVAISAVNKDGCSLTGISFKNLSSEVIFDLQGCNFNVNDVLEITLNLTGTTLNKTVVVEKGGGIYVKQ